MYPTSCQNHSSRLYGFDPPFNIGPTFMQIAGMLTVAAAMSKAGVLSESA